VKLRAGRHLGPGPGPSTIYMQLGDEPGDDDEWLGVIFDPARADTLLAIANGENPPLSTPGGPQEHKHHWKSDALCVPPQPGCATVLFRCGGCPMLAYGHATPDEIHDLNPPLASG
jgi:hypothetical protein